MIGERDWFENASSTSKLYTVFGMLHVDAIAPSLCEPICSGLLPWRRDAG